MSEDHPVSVVKINALTVPPEQWEVDTTPGFESFQLLRPTDDSHRWFVVTQWSSEEAFDDWMASRAFQQGHGAPSDGDGSPAASDEPADAGEPVDRGERPAPAATGAELLSFEVVQSSGSGPTP